MNLFNKINKKFDYFYDYSGHHFIQLLLIFHILYFLVLIGVVSLNIEYINFFYNTINVFLCLFLIIRFNPLRKKHELRANDPKMVFSISLFIILNMIIIELIKVFYPSKYDNIKNNI